VRSQCAAAGRSRLQQVADLAPDLEGGQGSLNGDSGGRGRGWRCCGNGDGEGTQPAADRRVAGDVSDLTVLQMHGVDTIVGGISAASGGVDRVGDNARAGAFAAGLGDDRGAGLEAGGAVDDDVVAVDCVGVDAEGVVVADGEGV